MGGGEHGEAKRPERGSGPSKPPPRGKFRASCPPVPPPSPSSLGLVVHIGHRIASHPLRPRQPLGRVALSSISTGDDDYSAESGDQAQQGWVRGMDVVRRQVVVGVYFGEPDKIALRCASSACTVAGRDRRYPGLQCTLCPLVWPRRLERGFFFQIVPMNSLSKRNELFRAAHIPNVEA